MMALVAAKPEANAIPYDACSAMAMARSNAPLVGFPVLLYSNPRP